MSNPAAPPQDPPAAWAKITSLNALTLSSCLFTENIVTFGRDEACTFHINDPRLSLIHCKISHNADSGAIQIEDSSSNGTFLIDKKIGKGNTSALKNGDTIWLLRRSKMVPDSDVIGFVFSTINNVEGLKAQRQQMELKEKQLQDQLEEEKQKKKKLEDQLSDEFTCPICTCQIQKCVSLMPCQHSFCGACYSDWMKKSKECPECRKKVVMVSRNVMINNIVEKFLDAHPELKQPAESLADMDKRDMIKNETVRVSEEEEKKKQPEEQKRAARQNGRARRRRRSTHSSEESYEEEDEEDVQDEDNPSNEDDEEDDEEIYPAFQAQPFQFGNQSLFGSNNLFGVNNAFNNNQSGFGAFNQLPRCTECTFPRAQDHFQCGLAQAHVACASCLKNMPNRNQEYLKQSCVICTSFFCNLQMPPCISQNPAAPRLEQMRNHTIPPTIDDQLFRGNRQEAQVLRDQLRTRSITTRDVQNNININQISKGGFPYKVNRTFQQNAQGNTETRILGDTAICTNCFRNVWFQMVFQQRLDITEHLPQAVRERDECWYGINCRTMTHTEAHASKLNHIVDLMK